jgi:hypothetical protein
MTPKHFIIDTNVLLVAALPEHENHPARQAAARWLHDFGSDSQAILIVDCESPQGHSSQFYLRPQFVPSIHFANARSRILLEYRRNLDPNNPYMQIIRAKLNDSSQSVAVYVDYAGTFAVLDDSIKSRVDPGDGKFVMAAINFIKHHVMGPRFRPTIVYAEDYADWLSCQNELENDYHIPLTRLG